MESDVKYLAMNRMVWEKFTKKNFQNDQFENAILNLKYKFQGKKEKWINFPQ